MTSRTATPAMMPSSPKDTVIISVSRVIMPLTKRLPAPMARMVPISPKRSVTDMTRVFMIMMTETTATMSMRRLKTVFMVSAMRAVTPAPSIHSCALASMPFSLKKPFSWRTALLPAAASSVFTRR